VWALVAGAIVRAAAQMGLSYRLLSGPRNRLAWNREAVRAVIDFGKWIFLSSAVGFLAAQVDRLILGKLLSLDRLGVYTIAFMLSNLPNDVVASLGFRVIFPAASRRAGLSREALRELILRHRRPLLWVLAVAVAGLATFGDMFVRFLYDDRYHDASWMLSILALGLWPRMLTNTMGPALMAIGQPRYLAYSGMLRFLLLCVAVPAAYHAIGLVGAVAAVAAGGLADYGVEVYGLRRHRLLGIHQDLRMTLAWMGVVVALLLTRSWLGLGLPF
jgi:O-antigen/teichoic acid export membrane protein